MKVFTAALLTMAMLSSWVEGGRRVLLVPFNINSHYLNFGRLGVEMAKLGDEVSMLVASNNNKAPTPRKGFEVLTFKSRFDVAFSNTREMEDLYYKVAMDKSLSEFYLWFKERWKPNLELEAVDLLTNKEMMLTLKQKNFEFIILETEPSQYIQLLPKLLNVPYAFFNIPFFAWHFGIPRLPSSVANILLGYNDQLNFKQRLISFSFDMYMMYLTSQAKPHEKWRQQVYEEFGVELIPTLDFLRNVSLFLYTEDPVLGFPQASMPFCFSVGDIMAAQPTSPLPEDLAFFVNQKPSILISFGSFFSHLPHQQTTKFCEVFAKAKELNFIWKFTNTSVCGEQLDNLLIRSWLPQNDLLAMVKGFVSHGGFNSVMEAVSHATPLILFPIAVDQHFQATMAEKKGFGIKMEISDWTADELLHNVRALVGGGSYKKSATHYSDILKHRPLSAAQRVSHAVDDVVRFGDGHLKGASNHLSWYQLLMFDVFLFILVVFVIIVFVVAIFSRWVFKKIVRLVKRFCRCAKAKTQ